MRHRRAATAVRGRRGGRGIPVVHALAVWGAVGLAVGVADAVHAQTPSIEYIEPSAGFAKTRVTGISDHGVVVGWSLDLNDTSNGPVFRYAPGGSRTEYAAGGLPSISGDGRVVAFTNDFTPNVPPRLYYDDGTFRDLPNLTLGGQERQGRVTHLNHDGSVVMLAASYDRPGEGRLTSYRWTESGGAQIPPFPGGSTWNHANGMSSDGRIVVGDWASNSTIPSAAWTWTDGGVGIDTPLDPNGNAVTHGRMTAISGDGSKAYGWYSPDQSTQIPIIITNGVTTPIVWDGVLIGSNAVPSGSSDDGSVLVGSLGQFGSWIWTQETGALRANDFFILHGTDVSPTQNINNLVVSSDGLHFGGTMGMPALSAPRGFVVTLPVPGSIGILILAGFHGTARRRRK